MIAAIYARFSTDRQRDSSIDDQVAQATIRLTAESWTPGPVFSDLSTSGSTPVMQRPGGARLLSAAGRREFQILILEGLDRLSRDLVESESIVRDMEYAGIRIIGLADGYDSESAAGGRKLMRVFKGMMNEDYIEDLRKKTHRGLTGQVGRGYFAGGLPYGYRTAPDGDPLDPQGHHLQINPDQAATVRRIYADFASGKSPRTIAHELNAQQIPGPRGPWSVTAIYAQHNKSAGILANELYQGKYIWNRSRWSKAPGSGIRKRHERPRSEWITRDMPELRIIPPELWDQVQARRATVRDYKSVMGRTAKTLLAGLLVCGHCGGAVVAVDKRCYGCGRHKDRGTCRGTLRTPRVELESAVCNFVRDQILTDMTSRDLQRRMRELIKEREHRKHTRDLVSEIKQQERTVSLLVDAIARSGWSEALNQRLNTAEQELGRLRTENETLTRPASRIIPDLDKRFRALRDNLGAMLAQDKENARQALYNLLGKITILEVDGEVFAEFAINQQQILQAVAGSAASGVGSGGAICAQKHRILIRRLITSS